MKKYLLTAFLGSFVCIGFASADTVGDFTSDSTIGSLTLDNSSMVTVDSLMDVNADIVDGFYICISTDDIPYYLSYDGDSDLSSLTVISSNNYCSSFSFGFGDYEFFFNSDTEYTEKNLNGTFYVSSSPITYSSSSGGSSGGSSSGPILNATGQAYLGNVMSGIQSVVSEFIPYLVYISLGILVVTLGFIAVRWLMNYISRRVTGLFSSRRRK